MGKFLKSIDNFFRNSVSPIFVLMLFVSFALWYISKLDYDYTTNIPVRVNIDGYKFKIECTAEGRGSAHECDRNDISRNPNYLDRHRSKHQN